MQTRHMDERMKYATRQQLAEHFEVSVRTFDRWRADPNFPKPCADGKRYVFDKVVAWFERPKKASPRSRQHSGGSSSPATS